MTYRLEEHRTHWMQQSEARVHSADLRIGCTTFDLQEKWYKYRDDCYEQIARDWCERFGIEIEE